MIQLKDISFGYQKQQALFHDLNLTLQDGNIYGLLGKNGAGKTSLLKIISGLLFPKQGTNHAFGFTPAERHPDFLADVFFIPEEFPVGPVSIQSFARTYSVFYPKFNAEQFAKVLAEFQLDAKANMSKLSFGQKKKAVLAFGIAANTRLLILDEPTNGLDIPSKTQFRKVISEMIDETRTVIISTHQVRDLGTLMDPIIIIDGGKVLFNQSMEAITEKLEFRLVQSLSEPADALYFERVPGGFMAIYPNDGSRYSEPDIEILFNAIIQHTPAVLAAFA